jgi:hypothetical protein
VKEVAGSLGYFSTANQWSVENLTDNYDINVSFGREIAK